MKQILVVMMLLFSIAPTLSQDYPNYSITALDRVFNQRIANFTGKVPDTSNKVIVDTSLIHLAKQNIYFPTSIGLHFSNVDSVFNTSLEKLAKKEARFMLKVKRKGFRNVSSKEFRKNKSCFKEITTDSTLRLCFYLLYDIEMSENKSDVLIIDWEKDGRKYYNPQSDSSLFFSIKKDLTEEVTNHCSSPIGKYSFFIFRGHGEVYPKQQSEDHYQKFYTNDWVSWMAVGAINNELYNLNSKQEFRIAYSHLNITCNSTVECPENENIFFDGGGSGTGSGFGEDAGN